MPLAIPRTAAEPMKKLILALVCLVAPACSGGFGTMDRIMSSWQGAHIDEVISAWGYPEHEANMAGKHVYY